MSFLYDHVAPTLSELDLQMIRSVPPGGNWTDIPNSIPSRRLEQIREMARQRGGAVRTTYYGRLRADKPSYTVSTYFNRPGNGCNIHPSQDRTLTVREAARLQSFPDTTRFVGSESSRRKQVGNAVPVLLGRAVGILFPPGTVVDLFAGAGGLSFGLSLAGHNIVVAADGDDQCLEVHASLHPTCRHIHGDFDHRHVQDAVVEAAKRPDLLVGGPPCQGWSYGGWHDHSDPRNTLVWTFIKMLERLRPRAFLMENVQGLMWMTRGKALTRIMREMQKIGYSVDSFVLNAVNYGVPQRRHRVFIVGQAECAPPNPPEPLFAEGHNSLFLPPPITVGEAIGDLPPVGAGQKCDEVRWLAPTDGVPYREWCRGLIDFDTMYERIKTHWQKSQEIGSSQSAPTMGSRLCESRISGR